MEGPENYRTEGRFKGGMESIVPVWGQDNMLLLFFNIGEGIKVKMGLVVKGEMTEYGRSRLLRK